MPVLSKTTLANAVDAAQSECLDDVSKMLGVAGNSVAKGRGLVCPAKARHVEGDRPPKGSNAPSQVLPVTPGAGVAVHEDHALLGAWCGVEEGGTNAGDEELCLTHLAPPRADDGVTTPSAIDQLCS
jgi:hypothetical protein